MIACQIIRTRICQLISKTTIATFEALSVYTPDTAGQGTDPALTLAHAELRRMVLESVVSPHTRRNYGKLSTTCLRSRLVGL